MTPDLLQPADWLASYLSELPSLAWQVGETPGPEPGDDPVPVMERLPVLVDRQLDLEATVAEAVAKALGSVLLIGLAGWTMVDPEECRSRLTLDLTFNLSLWSVPVMAGATMPAQSELLARVLVEIARFVPQAHEDDALPMPSHLSRWKQSRGELAATKHFITYTWNATTRVEVDLKQ